MEDYYFTKQVTHLLSEAKKYYNDISQKMISKHQKCAKHLEKDE
jgi:hypothetical protein